MDTPSSTAVCPPDESTLFVTNPLRASLALALGGQFAGHVSDGGDSKMLTFRIEGAPKNFVQDHESGKLCVPTDMVEQKFAFITNAIREHTRGLEARARANRAALAAATPGGLRLPAKSR